MSSKVPPGPIIPANTADPTGVDRLERGVMLVFADKLKQVVKVYQAALERIQSRPVINAKYTFALDIEMLTQLLDAASLATDEILLQGGQDSLWFFQGYGSVAYQRGTAQEYASLAKQSPVYAAANERGLQGLIQTPEYRLRIGLIRAREFEEIKGLSGQVKGDMSRILTDGIARGRNPRAIADSLAEQTGIEQFRANRIARTEITTALRRARMDESDDATEKYNLKTKQMHLSALSPTTRLEHALRHGRLFTTDEQREWWASDANSINCKCSTVSVLVGADGKPLRPSVLAGMQEQRDKWKEENEPE